MNVYLKKKLLLQFTQVLGNKYPLQKENREKSLRICYYGSEIISNITAQSR